MLPISVGAVTLAAAGYALTFALLNQSRSGNSQNKPENGTPVAAVRPVNATLAVPDSTTPIQNVHTTTWTLSPNGDLHQEEEMWYEDGRWRKEGTYGSRLIIGGAGYPHGDGKQKKKVYGTYYRYDASRHTVVHMPEVGEQRTDFTFASILPANERQNLITVRTEMIDGQEVTEYQSNRDSTTRWRFWVNRKTGLPVRRERAVLSDNGTSAVWKTIYREEYEFNKPMNASLFESSTLKDEGWRG